MQAVSPNDFSNEAHPFGTAREIEIGMGLARAHRVTYVGELGWELYVSSDQAAHVFETLAEAGRRSRAEALRAAHARFLPHRKGLPPFRP
jgi:glycine cleavage system aminomethyltransferase T